MRKAIEAYFQGFGLWFWGWMLSEFAFFASWKATANWGWLAALMAGLAIGPIITFCKYYAKKEAELGEAKKRADEAERRLESFNTTREQENKLVLFLEEGKGLNQRKVTSDEELAQLTLDCNGWFERTIGFLNTAFSPAKAALFRNGKLMAIEWTGGFNTDHNCLTKGMHMRLEVLKGFLD